MRVVVVLLAVGWLVLAAGCHAGAGPVIALHGTHVRAGAELSGGIGPAGGSFGGTRAIAGESRTRIYRTFEPGYMTLVRNNPEGIDGFVGFGGSIGWTSNDDTDSHFVGGVWSAPLAVEKSDTAGGSDMRVAFSVCLGVRWLGGLTEVYLSPKLSVVQVPGVSQ